MLREEQRIPGLACGQSSIKSVDSRYKAMLHRAVELLAIPLQPSHVQIPAHKCAHMQLKRKQIACYQKKGSFSTLGPLSTQPSCERWRRMLKHGAKDKHVLRLRP